MMFYTSFAFALLVALYRVQADEEDLNEDLKSCLALCLPENVEKHCCKDLKNLVHNEEYSRTCGDPTSREWTCTQAECILKKFDLMNAEEINYDQMAKHLDEHLKEYPENKDMVDRVRSQCGKGKFEDFMPDDLCLAIKFQMCIFANVMVECKKWEEDHACQEVSKDAMKCKHVLDKTRDEE